MSVFITFLIIIIAISFNYSVSSIKWKSGGNLFSKGQGNLKISVFGASGGVGQQICDCLNVYSKISDKRVAVTAFGRNPNVMSSFELLQNEVIQFKQADLRDLPSLIDPEREVSKIIKESDSIVISVGTTAFPTYKWEKDLNKPEVACYLTVKNLLIAMETMQSKCKNVVLISSVGVDRCDRFPYKLLNSFGVLDAKKASEDLLINQARLKGFNAIICRPGRLVGSPFTNNDLAKLFQIDQGTNRGILIDSTGEDRLDGDAERRDVAETVARILLADRPGRGSSVVFSLVNKSGNKPNSEEWDRLLEPLLVN